MEMLEYTLSTAKIHNFNILHVQATVESARINIMCSCNMSESSRGSGLSNALRIKVVGRL